MARGRAITYSDWHKKLKVVDFSRFELIGYTLFHRQTYTSATTLSLEFFTAAPAQPNPGLVNGNMKSNTLQAGYHFLIQAIRVAILADTRETAAAAPAAGLIDGSLEDVKELIYDGVGQLKINDKPYGEYPIHMTPAGGGPYGLIAVPGTLTAPATSQLQVGMNGPPDPRAVMTLAVPIPIPPLTAFSYTLGWDAAKTLVIGNTAISVAFDGQLLRPRQ